MQKQKTWKMLVNHLSEEDSNTEKEIFLKWLDQNEKNKILFYNVKKMWDNERSIEESFKQSSSPTFLGRFTKQKIKNFIINQAVGKLIGFMVGMWVTASFSHYVLEKRGIKNLSGTRHQLRAVS